jgi:hypothetical protein
MGSTLAAWTLAISLASTGGLFYPKSGGRILPPGPGPGWGFPNGNPDGYGYVDYGTFLPLGADRTAEYFFPRYYSAPAVQLVMPTYFNPYVTRGQRFIPYAGCGGAHPAGGAPSGNAGTPIHPYRDAVNASPLVPTPSYTGRSEGTPVQSGGSGLIP